jgi:hypothetical protein
LSGQIERRGERGGPAYPARYATQPLAPSSPESPAKARLGAPLVLARALRSIYDLGLEAAFRSIEVAGERQHVADAADREVDR